MRIGTSNTALFDRILSEELTNDDIRRQNKINSIKDQLDNYYIINNLDCVACSVIDIVS